MSDILHTWECGSEGSNVQSTAYADGKLIISGTGDINPEYNADTQLPPWYDCSEHTTTVVIGEGITSIGADENTSALIFSPNNLIKEIQYPDSLTVIPSGSANTCSGIEKIVFGNSVTTVGHSLLAPIEDYGEAEAPAVELIFTGPKPEFLSDEDGKFIGTGRTISISYPADDESWQEVAESGELNGVSLASVNTLPKVTLSLSSSNEEYGSVTGAGEYEQYAVVEISAVHAEDGKFVSWNDGNTDPVRSVKLYDNMELTAQFASDAHNVQITGSASDDEQGMVIGSTTANEGEEVILSAIPKEGFYFTGWSDGITDNPRTVVVGNTAAEYTAVFERQMYYETTITINRDGTLGDGTEFVLSADPIEGYKFLNWEDGDTSNPRTIIVHGTTTHVATFAFVITCDILVEANDETLGSVKGSGTYEVGTEVIIEAEPEDGNRFVQWDDGNTDNPRAVIAEEDRTYTAQMEVIPVYTVNVSPSNEEYGYTVGSGEYREGTELTISAVAKDHCKFTSWSDGNTEAIRTLTVTSDLDLTAELEWITYYFTITAKTSNPNYGSVSGGGEYPENTAVILEAVPASVRHKFVKWNDGDTNPVKEIILTNNVTYMALFDEIPYFAINAFPNNPDMGSVEGAGEYPVGYELDIRAIPADDHRFIGWSDGVLEAERHYTVERNVTVTAIFEAIKYCEITVITNNEEYGTVDGAGIYPDKTTAVITATATEDHRFIGWDDGNTDPVREIEIVDDATYRAIFELVIQRIVSPERYKGKLGRIKASGHLYSSLTLIKSLPDIENECIELGQFDTGTGRHFIFVSVKQPMAYNCKQYTISLNHNHTSGDWFKVEPIDESDIIDTSYQLEVKADGVSAALRLKRILHSDEQDFQIVIQNLGMEDENWFEGNAQYIDEAAILGTIASVPAGNIGGTTDHLNLANRGEYTHAEIDEHIDAENPHTGHELISSKNVADGYAGLNEETKLLAEHIPFGNDENTVCEGNDPRLSDRRIPVEHADSHKAEGSDELSLMDLAGNLTQERSHDEADTDVDEYAIHHTLGLGHTQAAPGDHTHVEEYDQRYAPIAKGVEGGSDHIHDGNETPKIKHSDLLEKGDYTHDEIDAHINASNPHLGHESILNKNIANGYAGLNGMGKLSSTVYDFGSGEGTVCQGNDPRLTDHRAPGEHSVTHNGNGSDPIFLTNLGGNLDQDRSHDNADTDSSAEALHHTLGTGEYQAAAGNHTHDSAYAPYTVVLATAAGLGENIALEDTGDGYVLMTRVTPEETDENGDVITEASTVTRMAKLSHSDLEGTGTKSHEEIDTALEAAEYTSNKNQPNGYAGLDENGMIPGNLISMSSSSAVPSVGTYDDLTALENVSDGTRYMVSDASGDPTVESGWAEYMYSEAAETWIKLASQESMDIEVSWEAMSGKPESSVEAIDTAVRLQHTQNSDTILAEGSENEVSAQEIKEHLDNEAPHTGHELISAKGEANGYCELDGDAKIPLGRLPDIPKQEEAAKADEAKVAKKADALTNYRTVSLTGDASGSFSFNGSSDVSCYLSIETISTEAIDTLFD